MSTLALTLSDSRTMVRRSLLHIRRYPSLTITLIALPVVFLLLFVYVFGGTLGAGLGGPGAGRSAYLAYLTPGILLLAAASAAMGTAVSVAMDMTEGIVARFRTMPIARSALLTGHVLGSMAQAAICLVVVLGVALALGYRPAAGPLDWLGVVGVLALFSFALTWLSVAFGMVSRSVETASNLPTFLTLLPFLGSGFVPTDSLPGGLRWFAEHQPFTPVVETLRGLLAGAPDGDRALLAVGWCLVIALGGHLWSRSLYRRRAPR